MSIKKNIKSYMDTTHESMIWAVVGFALDPSNLPVTSSIPPLQGYVTNLQTNMNMVRTLRASIAMPSTGIAADNKALRDLLSGIGTNIMSAAYSFAIDTNNMTLAGKMKITTSALEEMKIETFIGISQGAINEVTPIVSGLSSYGVTSLGVTGWQNLLTQLGSQIANVKGAIAFRKSVNEQIQSLLKGNMVTLYNNCDRVVTQLRDTNSAYYSNYKAVRKLFPHNLSTQLRIWVTNPQGQVEPVGEVFIVGTDRSAMLNSEGYALVDSIPFGSHSVTVATPQYENTYGPYDFKKGKSLTLHVQVGILPEGTAAVRVTEEEMATDEISK